MTEHKPDEVPEVIGDDKSPDLDVDQTPTPDTDLAAEVADEDIEDEA